MDRIEAGELLGVDGDASPGEVRSAYRKSLKQWHPDRFGGDPKAAVTAAEQTRRIIAAYRTLTATHPDGLAPTDQSHQEVPSFWRQLNPLDGSHYRYSPNTVWDGVAMIGVTVGGIVLLLVLKSVFNL